MAKIPQTKGTSFLPTVIGVKSNRVARARVPEHLKHYLEETILVTTWYPEDAYHELIQILVDATPAEAVGGNVWRFFGQISAQRDIGGDQERIPENARVQTPGLYRGYVGGQLDLADMFVRNSRLWRVYHDTGTMSVHRSANDPFVVVSELEGFFFPCFGVADLLAAYTQEYARLLGHAIDNTVAHLGKNEHDPTVWRASCERTEANRAALSRLPMKGS